jgi:hypothetical protein
VSVIAFKIPFSCLLNFIFAKSFFEVVTVTLPSFNWGIDNLNDHCPPGVTGCDKDTGGGGGGGGKDKAKKRLAGDCLKYVLDALKKAFAQKNKEDNSNGYLVSKEVKDAQSDVTNADKFEQTMSNATVQVVSNPPKNESSFIATASGTTIKLYPNYFPSSTDQALTFIHETFHLTPYDFNDVDMAHALNAPFTSVPGDAQATMNNASVAWNEKLQKACGKK